MMRHEIKLLSLLLTMICIFSVLISCDTGDDEEDDSNKEPVADDDDDATDDDDDDDDDDNNDDNDDDDNDDNDNDTTMVTGCVEGNFDPYWGVLHAHTRYSDGDETPADAFVYARDNGELDIMIVTDHLEQLYLPVPPDKYEKCFDQADDNYDPGYYLTDCGFEYGSGFILPWFQSTGHNNVFYSPDLFPVIQLDFHNFYNSLVDCSTCVGQFNHPGSDPTQTWNDFEYFEDVDIKMNLFEFNGGGLVWDLYFDALDAGWHISAMYNQDNHSADWGTKNDRRSGFFLSDLNRENLYEAMMARRSFMSYDKNAYIKITADTTCSMGSILSGYSNISIDVEAVDLDVDDGFDNIEIYGPDMNLLTTVDCTDQEICTDGFDFAVTEATYYVAKATQTDGEWLVSGPIWVEP